MCKFCEEYECWKELNSEKSDRQKEMKVRDYYRVCLRIKTFNKYGRCGTYTGRSHYLRYCPECGRKL